LPGIEIGKALPVEFDEVKDAIGLQQWVLYLNTHNSNGTKYRVQRSGLTVYISKVSA
jgi:hypothetical protein